VPVGRIAFGCHTYTAGLPHRPVRPRVEGGRRLLRSTVVRRNGAARRSLVCGSTTVVVASWSSHAVEIACVRRAVSESRLRAKGRSGREYHFRAFAAVAVPAIMEPMNMGWKGGEGADLGGASFPQSRHARPVEPIDRAARCQRLHASRRVDSGCRDRGRQDPRPAGLGRKCLAAPSGSDSGRSGSAAFR
jgi:hypothetical protein